MKNCTTLLFGTLMLLYTSVAAQDFRFGKVSKEELMEKTYPKDSSAAASVLFRNEKINFTYTQNTGFSVVRSIHERVKIYAKDGFEHATVAKKLYKSGSDRETLYALKAYTYNLENGTIKKDKLQKQDVFATSLNKYRNEEKFTLPNIKEGCIVEYQYKITSPFYYSIDEIILQYDIPIKKQEISIATPEYFVYKPTMKGYLTIEPRKGTKSGKINFVNKSRDSDSFSQQTNYSSSSVNYTIHITDFDMTDVPALKEEPYVNSMNNYRSAINYELSYVQFPQQVRKSYTTTWEKVIKTIYDSDDFGGQLGITKYYKNDLEKIITSTSDDKQRLWAIFYYMQQRMNWNNFVGYSVDKGVKKAYEERSGSVADINLALTSMLKSAGFTANPVLVSTRDHGVPLSPTMEGFNYVVAAVELEGTMILLDASNKYTLPGLLPTRALNWFGKLVKEDGTSATLSLQSNRNSKKQINANFSLSAEGTVSGKIRKAQSHYKAYAFRNANSNRGEEDYLEDMENTNGMEISEYEVKNKKDLGNPVTEEFKFLMEGKTNVIGDKMYFSPLFHLTMDTNPFILEQRNHPIDFTYPFEDKYLINIALPEGYEVLSKPEDMTIGLPDNLGVFTYKISQNGNFLQILSDMKISSAIIATNYYASLKEFFKNCVEKQTEQVVLSKITANGNSNGTTDGR